MKMKSSSTPYLLVVTAALAGGVCGQQNRLQQDVPVVGLGSVAPIGRSSLRRLSSSSTSSSHGSWRGVSGEDELIQALQADNEVTGEDPPSIPHTAELLFLRRFSWSSVFFYNFIVFFVMDSWYNVAASLCRTFVTTEIVSL